MTLRRPFSLALALLVATSALIAGPVLHPRPALASTYSTAVEGNSPSVYYRLGESSGSTAADSSGNSVAGTYGSSATLGASGAIAGDSDTGITTSGANAAVTASDSSLPSGTSARTMEVWFKTSNNSAVQTLAVYGTLSSSEAFGLLLCNNAGGLCSSQTGLATYFYAGPGTAVFFPAAVPIFDNHWHLAETELSSGTVTTYLDGQLLGSGSAPSGINTTSGGGLALGYDAGAGAYSGSLDEFAIYPGALSASTIATHWQDGTGSSCATASGTYAGGILQDSPLAYYRLGESSLGRAVAADGSGNCTNGIYSSNTSFGQIGAINGDSDTAITSPGTEPALVASDSSLPSGTSARTMEIWFKTSSTGANQTLAIYGQKVAYNNAAFAFMICHNSAACNTTGTYLSVFFYYAANWTVSFPIATNVLDNHWHYAAVSMDSSRKVAGYIDGLQLGTGTGPTGTSTSVGLGSGLQVGYDASSGGFSGQLDEFAVYNKVLNPTQIANHWMAGTLQGGAFSGSQTYGQGPVDPATGNFFDSSTDISIPGRSLPLAFTRAYNAQASSSNGPLGYGWTSNYLMSLAVSGSTATITKENGSTISFTQSGSTWNPASPRVIATLTHNGDGTWTLVRRAQLTYTFNSSGQLTSIADLNGYTTSLSYSSGNLSSITDEAGRSLSIGWTGSHITSVTDSNVSPSRSVSYGYDGSGNLSTVTDLNGHVWHLGYSSHLLNNITDPVCYAASGCPGVQIGYDGSTRVTSLKDQLNDETDFDYTSIANATKITNPVSDVTVDYFVDGLLTKQTAGYGTSSAATSYVAHDPNTLSVVSQTDADGNTTAETVDSNANVLTTGNALSHSTTNTYNSANQLATNNDLSGVTTTYSHDSNGNLTQISRPLDSYYNQVTGYCYNYSTSSSCYTSSSPTKPGDLVKMTDSDGKSWTYTYDSYGNQITSTDPLGNGSSASYNADGEMTSAVSPKGNVSGCSCASSYTTSYTYYADGQVHTVTDPLSNVTTRTYDTDGRLSTVQDGNGNTTTYLYDWAGRTIHIQRPDTTQTTTDYNADGTVHDQKNAAGHTLFTYGYDALGRVTSRTDALSHETDYKYDPAGNLVNKIDPSGTCTGTPSGCTTYTYDAANELTGITYSDGSTHSVTYSYDNLGRRTQMVDGTGTSTYTYDQLGRLTSFQNGHGDSVSYGYTGTFRNAPVSITYPGTHTENLTYFDNGQVDTITDWNSKVTDFDYDPNGNLATETLPSSTGVVDSFTYDHANALTAILDTNGGTTLFSTTYGRDSNHQLSSDTSATSSQGSYKYNSLNQLCYAGSSTSSACSSPPSGSQAFAFDSSDNLSQLGSQYQLFNNADQICASSTSSGGTCSSPPSGATTYTYDSRGNRTASGSTTLSYDQANRLTAYGSAGTYAYNGDGLRESKTVSGTTTQELWNPAGNLLQDGSTDFIYGPLGPLEQINGSTTLYLHQDQIGSTRLITDASGASAATYTYDPYGNLASSSGSASTPLRYAGQYQDSETGLYYLRARYYEPSTGQFLTLDLAVDSTLQPYGYVGGSPLNGSDPSGLDGWGSLQNALITLGRGWQAASAGYADTAAKYGDPNFSEINPTTWGYLADQDVYYLSHPGTWGSPAAQRIGVDNARLFLLLTPFAGAEAAVAGADAINFVGRAPEFRQAVTDAIGEAPTDAVYEAHHIFPVQFGRDFADLGIDINKGDYGAWVEKSLHQGMSSEYAKDWEAFFGSGNRGARDAFQFAKMLAQKYGY